MFKTSLIYFAIRAVNGALALATIYVLTRLLSAEQYGLYALGMAGISLCGAVLFQWISVSVSRFYAAHAAEPDALLSEAFRLFSHVAAAGIFVVVIYAVWPSTRSVTPVFVLTIGAGAIAMGLHSLGLQFANARVEPVKYGLLTVSRGVIALGSAVAFVQAGFGGLGAMFGFAVASILSVILFGARRLTTVRYNSPELRRQMVVYGLPLTLTFFSTMVLDVSDRFMIGWFIGTHAVAGYAASYDLTQQTIGAILNVLFLVSYPRVTAAWEAGGVLAARQAMLPLSQATLLITPLVTGIFIGEASYISRLIFGSSFTSAGNEIIPWVAFAIAVSCFKSYCLDIAFQLTKNIHLQLRITVLMAVLNVLLNIILIPRFGVLGAAMATVIAFLSGAGMSWYLSRQVEVFSISLGDIFRMVMILFVVVSSMQIVKSDVYSELFTAFLRFLIGSFSYLAAVFITNIANVRSAMIRKFHKSCLMTK